MASSPRYYDPKAPVKEAPTSIPMSDLNECNQQDAPFVLYGAEMDPIASRRALLMRSVMCFSIAGAVILLFGGIFYLTSSSWWVGIASLLACMLCVLLGYFGAKKKDPCILLCFSILCSAILGWGIASLIIYIVQLAKIGALTDEEFAADYPFYNSKGDYIGIGVAGVFLDFFVLVFWAFAAYYAVALTNHLKKFPRSSSGVPASHQTHPNRIYGVATPGVTPAGYYIERQGDYTVAQPIAQGVSIGTEVVDRPPPYISHL